MRPTLTLAQLRAQVCVELSTPFSSLFPSNQSVASGGGSGYLVDVKLGNITDYWKGQYLYLPSSGHVAKIVNYDGTLQRAYFSPAVSITSGTTYEITGIFSAHEIKNAINSAIEDAFPNFFDTGEYYLPCGENTSEFDVQDGVASIAQILVELPYSVGRSVITSTETLVGVVRLHLRDSVSQAQTGDVVVLYGDIEKSARPVLTTVSAYGADYIDVPSSDLTGIGVPAGTKITWYSPRILRGFDAVHQYYTDTPEFPNRLILTADVYRYAGMRLIIKYIKRALTLNNETDTTIIPRGFVVPKAVSILASSKIADNRVDRTKYAQIAEIKLNEAERFRQRYSFRLPSKFVNIGVTFPSESFPFNTT